MSGEENRGQYVSCKGLKVVKLLLLLWCVNVHPAILKYEEYLLVEGIRDETVVRPLSRDGRLCHTVRVGLADCATDLLPPCSVTAEVDHIVVSPVKIVA